jgi:glycosyltransferase involved in cell wall biosynthesis
MTMPTFSIIMPSFNQSIYLEEAICSLLDQTYPDREFMILDGGSTDGSQAIIKRDSGRLTYRYSRPDKGQTYALLQGEYATGDLLGWVNSDDVLLPGCLHSIAQVYDAYCFVLSFRRDFPTRD